MKWLLGAFLVACVAVWLGSYLVPAVLRRTDGLLGVSGSTSDSPALQIGYDLVRHGNRSGILYLLPGMEQGDPDAIFLVADLLWEGRIVGGTGVADENGKMACEMYEMLAGLGIARAASYVGRCWETGRWGRVDETLAAGHYIRGAEAGDAFGMVSLAKLVAWRKGSGKDIPPRYAKVGASWLTRGAELEDPEAQTLLAGWYERGNGLVTEDSSKALYWYRKAAGAIQSPPGAVEGYTRLALKALLAQAEDEDS